MQLCLPLGMIKWICIHDINPRIASGIIFSLEAGAVFDKLIIDHLLEDTTDTKKNTSYMHWVRDGAELYSFNVCSYFGDLN